MDLALDSRRKILVLSPHLDDGVLSVGGTIARAAALGVDVIVATPFTADAPDTAVLSPIALELHSWWNFGPNPYEHRRREDIAAVSAVGGRPLHGQLLDCVYRDGRDGMPLYATRESVFSEPSSRDDVSESLARLFRNWSEELRPDLVLCPLGVGCHVDHVLCTEALRRVASALPLNVGLYEELPYATGIFPVGAPDTVGAAVERSSWQVTGSEFVTVDLPAKLSAISKYASQIPEIFRGGIEVASVLSEYMRFNEPDSRHRERIWMTEP